MSRRDDRIAATLVFRILTAANRIARPFKAEFGNALGLSLNEWRCMIAIAAVPGSTGEDVAQAMGMEPMTVSRGLRGLEKAARAQRVAIGTSHAWTLTEQGWAVFDEIVPRALQRDEEAFAELDADARSLVAEVLDRI